MNATSEQPSPHEPDTPHVPFWRREEFLVALATLLIGVWVLWVTTTFRRPPPMLSPGLMPHEFPQLLVYLLFALCGVSIFQTWREKATPRKHIKPIVWWSMAVIVAFCGVMLIDLFLGFVFFFFALSWVWGERRYLPMTIVTIALPLGIFILFDQVLEVRFPRGLLTSIYYDWH